MNATRTFADEISLATMGLETRVERHADGVTISWPIYRTGGVLTTIARLVRLTGIDAELFERSIATGRIYLDMPSEIADAE